MPTTHPRIQVTVTDELRQALAAARTQWPTLPESQLLAALACRGAGTLAAEAGARPAARAAALEQARADLAGCYPPGYLDDLRAEWPA